MSVAESMRGAEFVLIDGTMCEAAYLRPLDEDMEPDDIVLEARHGDAEIDFIRADFDGALPLGDDEYQLASGRRLLFLSAATLH